MSISASLVKELRERTGAGMMECKKALVKTEGDINEAADLLRKEGAAKADKKSDRVAAEGMIVTAISDNNTSAAIVEINSETDFVARDDNFKKFAQALSKHVLDSNVTDVSSLSDSAMADGRTVEQARQQLIATVGENIIVRRAATASGTEGVGHYVHGGRIGVIVQANTTDQDLLKDLAMHIAASNPSVINPKDVPSELVEKEKEIFQAQAAESGKPEEIIQKMIQGRINKFVNEVSLVEQPFVKNPDQKVKDLLPKGVEVKSFIRYAVGEGIEKKVENFAEEVKAQMRS